MVGLPIWKNAKFCTNPPRRAVRMSKKSITATFSAVSTSRTQNRRSQTNYSEVRCKMQRFPLVPKLQLWNAHNDVPKPELGNEIVG